MTSRLQSLPILRQAGIYTIANAINSAIPLLLLPILTRYLTPHEYGLVSMFTVVTIFVSAIAGFGTHGAITREFYHREPKEFAEFVGTCIVILLVSAFGILLLITIFRHELHGMTGIPEHWMAVPVLMAVSQLLSSIGLVIWQVRGLPVIYGAFQIGMSLLNASLSLLLIVGLDFTWEGRVIGQLGGLIFGSAISAAVLVREGWISLRFRRKYARPALRYGFPMVFHALGAASVVMADKMLIANFVSLAETGLYVVAGQIAMAITFVADSFNRAYAPWLFQRLREGNPASLRRIVIGTYCYFALVLLLAGLLALVAPFIINIVVGPKFALAHQYVLWLGLAAAFGGMYYMVTLYIQFSGKTERLAAVTLIVGTINIPLTYLLLKAEGGIGAAHATALSQLIIFLATWWVAARLIDMDWFFRKSVSVHEAVSDIEKDLDGRTNMNRSIFSQYFSSEQVHDRYLDSPEGTVDVIIPVIHTNELWEKNLISIYREIPVNRLLISDGGCVDGSIDIVRRFPRVVILDHREYRSLGYCLRKLIDEVQTEWFVYLHSDVYLPPGWFDAMKKHQGEFDWFGCPQRITAMVEYPNVDMLFGERRPYAGSQMGRRDAFIEGMSKIDDDYVYRQEDLVLRDVVEQHGFRHGFVEDMFHYHQVMHKESPWARNLKSVSVKVEWSREEEVRASVMQIKGIVKYLEPSQVLALEVEAHLRRLIELAAINQDEFNQWVQETNPVWTKEIKLWRVRTLLLSERLWLRMRRLLNLLRSHN